MYDIQAIKILNTVECIALQLAKDRDQSLGPDGENFTPGDRWIVSLSGGLELPVIRSGQVNLIRDWVEDNYLEVVQDDLFFGRWYDRKFDIVCFDVSRTFDSLKDAVNFAERNSQRAIFDSELNIVINL